MSRRPTYRQPTLRQIEAFKAVIEFGTVSRAAEVLNMSQPAASKLLANLEADTGLELFERRRGLLVPNERGIRFYEEVDRIFSGLGQINRAVENMRREERGRLVIGVLPGLSGTFICDVIRLFRLQHPDVHIEIHGRSSRYLFDWLRSGNLDLAVVAGQTEDTHHVEIRNFLNMPLVMALPTGNLLSKHEVISVADLAEAPLIGFMQGSYTRLQLERMFDSRGISPNIIMQASNAQNVCEMVASGFGSALIHPLLIDHMRDRVDIRPLADPIAGEFLICRPRHVRNRQLANAFIGCLETAANGVMASAVSA